NRRRGRQHIHASFDSRDAGRNGASRIKIARLLGLRRSHGQPAAAITHSLERRAPPKNRTSEAKIDRSPDERTADELADAGKHSSKKLWRILGRRNFAGRARGASTPPVHPCP